MTFVRPLLRFRRVRSEQFHDGYLLRARQHLSFELGGAYDLRSELAELKQEVARLTAELAKQKTIGAMARAALPRPETSPCRLCGGPSTPGQPLLADRVAASHPSSEPIRPRARQADDSCLEQIVLIVDDNWPQ